jgi:hypothetical protein
MTEWWEILAMLYASRENITLQQEAAEKAVIEEKVKKGTLKRYFKPKR